MSQKHRWSFLLLFLVLGFLGASLAAGSPPNSQTVYLDIDGEPLPFATDDELVDFLATAPIVDSKRINRGISGTLKLTLERDGVRARAAFRTVDIERSASSSGAQLDRHIFRDSYTFEVAAYRLSRMLGLARVPPATLRTVDGREGSVQLWIEDAVTEADLIKSGQAKLDARRHLQRQTMLVFDNLIYNFDRHQHNMLYDVRGRLWYIDHTRSFKRLGELPDRNRIAVVSRDLYERLKTLEPTTFKENLGRLLDNLELAALRRRQRLLVKHFDRLIAERGETRVLLPSA